MRSWTIGALAGVGLSGAAAAAQPLVDAAWLAEQLDEPDLVVLDIRNRIDGGSEEVFRAGHIPGAVYSNYGEDGWRTERNGVPGMLPDAGALAELIGGLGIDNDDHVVIVHGGVSSSDFGSAARVYWTFQQVGHDEVSILDGGFAGWIADPDRPLATGTAVPEPATFEVGPAVGASLATAADVEAALDQGAALVDARPVDQFTGERKHDAARVGGHIPGAAQFSQASWFEAEGGALRDVDEVAAGLPADVAEGDGEVISYCNTGHWAATNWFMLSEVLGRDNVRLYDGSMTEWTADPARPIATN